MATGGGDTDINILSDETFDKLCITCKRKDKNSEADKYCIDCQDYYCKKCVKVHEDVPVLSDHEILDKDHLPSMRLPLPMPKAPTEQCERHKHKHVDMYCENHDVVGCSTCMTIDHGSCHGRFYISEYIKKDVTTDDIEQELKLLTKSLTENRIFFQNNKEQLLKERSKLLDKIKTFRRELDSKLDSLEHYTMEEINVKFESLIANSESQLLLLQTSKRDVLSAIKSFESSSASMSQKFVNYKKGKQIISDVGAELEEIDTHKQNTTFVWKPCKDINDLLETKLGLGKVRMTFRKDLLLNMISQEW